MIDGFRLVGDIQQIEIIATGRSIRILPLLINDSGKVAGES
jgi:hypothetical protein